MRAVQRQISDADARTVVEQLEAAKTAVGGDLVVARERLALASAALDKWERHLADRRTIAGKSSVKAKPRSGVGVWSGVQVAVFPGQSEVPHGLFLGIELNQDG
jgi:hypothetical protein